MPIETQMQDGEPVEVEMDDTLYPDSGGTVDPDQIAQLVNEYLSSIEPGDKVLYAAMAFPEALWDPATDPQPEMLPIPAGIPVLSYASESEPFQDAGFDATYGMKRWTLAGVGEMATLAADLNAAGYLGRIVWTNSHIPSNEAPWQRHIQTTDGQAYPGYPLGLNARQLAELPTTPVAVETSDATVEVPADVADGQVYICNLPDEETSVSVAFPTHNGELAGRKVFVVNPDAGGLGAPTVELSAVGNATPLSLEGSADGGTDQWAVALAMPQGSWTYVRLTSDPTLSTPGDWWGTSVHGELRGQLDELAARAKAAEPGLSFVSLAAPWEWDGSHFVHVVDVDSDSGNGDDDPVVVTLGSPQLPDSVNRTGWQVTVYHRVSSGAVCNVSVHQAGGDPLIVPVDVGTQRTFIANGTGWHQMAALAAAT